MQFVNTFFGSEWEFTNLCNQRGQKNIIKPRNVFVVMVDLNSLWTSSSARARHVIKQIKIPKTLQSRKNKTVAAFGARQASQCIKNGLAHIWWKGHHANFKCWLIYFAGLHSCASFLFAVLIKLLSTLQNICAWSRAKSRRRICFIIKTA